MLQLTSTFYYVFPNKLLPLLKTGLSVLYKDFPKKPSPQTLFTTSSHIGTIVTTCYQLAHCSNILKWQCLILLLYYFIYQGIFQKYNPNKILHLKQESIKQTKMIVNTDINKEKSPQGRYRLSWSVRSHSPEPFFPYYFPLFFWKSDVTTTTTKQTWACNGFVDKQFIVEICQPVMEKLWNK